MGERFGCGAAKARGTLTVQPARFVVTLEPFTSKFRKLVASARSRVVAFSPHLTKVMFQLAYTDA